MQGEVSWGYVLLSILFGMISMCFVFPRGFEFISSHVLIWSTVGLGPGMMKFTWPLRLQSTLEFAYFVFFLLLLCLISSLLLLLSSLDPLSWLPIAGKLPATIPRRITCFRAWDGHPWLGWLWRTPILGNPHMLSHSSAMITLSLQQFLTTIQHDSP